MSNLPIIPTYRYTHDDIDRLAQIVLGKVEVKDITLPEQKMLCAMDDSNGSSIREMVTAVALGFPPRLSNEKYEEDTFDQNGNPINVKPKNVSLTLIEEPDFIDGAQTVIAPVKSGKLLFGHSNYNDLTYDLLADLVNKNLQFIIAGYCGTNLLYGLKFPILVIAERLIWKIKNHSSRSKSIEFQDYSPYKDVEFLFIRPDINRYRVVLNAEFHSYLRNTFPVGTKDTPRKEDILAKIILSKGGAIEPVEDSPFFQQ
jgi:hypothetical protein